MAWYKKHFPTTWAAGTVLDDFVQVFMGLGGPARMMLIEEVHKPLDSTLWLWLPEAHLLDAFPGFEIADAAGLPKKAILLAGNKSSFEKQFEHGLRR
jgi:hypothetical protein